MDELYVVAAKHGLSLEDLYDEPEEDDNDEDDPTGRAEDE